MYITSQKNSQKLNIINSLIQNFSHIRLAMSNIIKNVISSTTHKKIYLSVNANIMMTQIFHEIRYDLKGHPRSYKTKFMAKFF